MRTVSIRLCDMERTCIPIGFVGENLYTRVRIDSKVVFDEYPTAIASLTVQDPNGSMYPGFISRDGDVIIWDVTASDLVYGGNGALQLAFFVDDVIAKSYICRTYVSKAMIGPGTIPTPIASWIDAANVVLGEAEEVFEALDNMTVAAETLAAGSTATAEITDVDGHKHIDFGIPKGDQGEQGETGPAGRDGADGFSPTLVVSTITGGHRITITDKVGTQTVDVLDGEKGETGATGNGIASVVLNQDYTLTINYTNGQSMTTTSIRGEKGETGATGQTGATGATPIISIGTVTTGAPGSEASATMDTTDPAHPVLSMSIPEGEPGDATIDDTSTAADRVWSAQKVNELKSALTQGKAPVILDTASGSIASVVDGADGMAVETLTVGIEPVQDLHGQESPYPAGGGKNKYSDIFSEYTKPVDYYICPIELQNGSYYLSTELVGTAITGCVIGIVKSGTQYSEFVGQINVLNTAGVNSNFSFLVDETWTNPALIVYCSGETQFNNLFSNYRVQLESGLYKTTFAPYSNICPISGWTGANVERTGVNVCEGKTNIIISISSSEASVINGTGTCLIAHLVEGQTYVFSNPDLNRRVVTYWDDIPSVGDTTPYFQSLVNNTFTAIRSGLALIYIYNASVDTSHAQVELGSTASTYEPYQGEQIAYPFPSQAGTVYGGTLTVNADGTGKLVVDRAGVDLGSMTWTSENDAVTGLFRIDYMNNPEFFAIAKFGENNLCSKYKPTKPKAYSLFDNDEIGFSNSADFPMLRIKDENCSTMTGAQFKASLSGVQFVYELKTPVVYNLTDLEVIALLKGTNNLWSDTGNTSIEYPADTKLYIDKKFAELQALILEN